MGRRRTLNSGKNWQLASFSSLPPGEKRSPNITTAALKVHTEVLMQLASLREYYKRDGEREREQRMGTAGHPSNTATGTATTSASATATAAIIGSGGGLDETVKVTVTETNGPRKSLRVPKRKRFSESEDEEDERTNSAKMNKTAANNDGFTTPVKGEGGGTVPFGGGKNVDQGQGESILTDSFKSNSHSDMKKTEIMTEPKDPVTSEEYFKGKELFVAAVMVLVNGKLSPGECERVGIKAGCWLQCGICKTLTSEVTNLSSNKKYGVFMCTKCEKFLQKMIKIAKRAQAFDCSGEGVCEIKENSKEGDDTLCEGCFVRNCLLILDFNDDIYFKLWRAVPPEAKNDLPHAPPKTKRYVNRGQVLFVNKEDGIILHSTSNIKLFGTTGTGVKAVADKKPAAATTTTGKGKGKIVSAPTPGKRVSLRGKGALEEVAEEVTKEEEKPEPEEIKNIDTSNENDSDAAKATMKFKDASLLYIEGAEEEKLIDIVPFADMTENEVEAQGYPVVVTGEEPPTPLCFSCGSAGINQTPVQNE